MSDQSDADNPQGDIQPGTDPVENLIDPGDTCPNPNDPHKSDLDPTIEPMPYDDISNSG